MCDAGCVVSGRRGAGRGLRRACGANLATSSSANYGAGCDQATGSSRGFAGGISGCVTIASGEASCVALASSIPRGLARGGGEACCLSRGGRSDNVEGHLSR
jgi:hypothetical protein